MKKILLIGFLAIFIQSISAQICHSELTRTSVLLKAVSTEIENQSGQVSYKLAVFAKDRVWLDSISVDSSFHSSFQTSFNFPKFLDSGDSDTIIIELDYDSNALPYYFKTIDHRLYTHGTEVSSSIHLVSANIYFTPYGSTEIWNMDDFSQLPRIWEIPFSPEPARVSIHKDSIPESNRPDLDSIQYEWQTEFQHVFYPGLPYAPFMQ